VQELLKKVTSPTELLRLTPTELAWAILDVMQKRRRDPVRGMVNRDSAVTEMFRVGDPTLPSSMGLRTLEKDLRAAFRKSFKLLEEWDLIEPADGENGKNGFLVLTERGMTTIATIDFEAIRQRGLLVPEMLHHLLRNDIYTDFQSGQFGKAVFGAFKIVEVEVRKAARRPDSEHGGELMRVAFNENKGPLTDMSEKPNHRDALRMLFAGSLSRFRNVQGHTFREFSDPFEAMQELMVASRLLRIVQERSAKPT
jgi:uncharacterized protein (TIGR02391 family)